MTILETVEAAKARANILHSHERHLRDIRAPKEEIAKALADWSAANDELNSVFFFLKKALGK